MPNIYNNNNNNNNISNIIYLISKKYPYKILEEVRRVYNNI